MNSFLRRILPIGSREVSRLSQPPSWLFVHRFSVLSSFSSNVSGKKTSLRSLSHLDCNFQTTRSYRVKKDPVLTIEQAFVCKVAKVSSSDQKTLDESCKRLRYLVGKGCKVYELVEYPEILSLSVSEIDERIERLRSCGQSDVSIPLLKFAKPENGDIAIKNSLRRYRKQQNGHLNKAEEIKSALRCSDEEMLEILTRNSRLIGSRKRKFIVEKVNCLLECGAMLEDIRCNTNLLNNKTLEDIETRARRLASLGYEPLPMGVIGRTDKEYEAIVDRLAKQKVLQPTRRYMDSKEIIAKIPEYSDKKLYLVKPKVDFLLSMGYVGDDIIGFPLILELNLGTIQNAVTHLHQHYLGLVSLELCHKYASAKRVTSRQRSVRKIFAKVLNCSSKELPQIPKDLSVSFNEETTYHTNLDFLKGKGFVATDLKELPIILAHDSEVLKQCWDVLRSDETLGPYFKLWKENKRLLLHLLQYSVERKFNFSFVAATDVSEEKRLLESGRFSPLVYDSQDFVPSDAKEYDAGHETEPDSNVGRELFAKTESLTEHNSSAEFSPNIELKSGIDHDVSVGLDSNIEADSDANRVLDVNRKSSTAADVNKTRGTEIRHDTVTNPNSDAKNESSVSPDSGVRPPSKKEKDFNQIEKSNSKQKFNQDKHSEDLNQIEKSNSKQKFNQDKHSASPVEKDQDVGMESVMTELFTLSSPKSSTRET